MRWIISLAIMPMLLLAEPLPDGGKLVHDSHMRIPRMHMSFPAQLSGKTRDGGRVSVNAIIELNFSQIPLRGAYTLLDEAGRPDVRLDVTWMPNQAPGMTFTRGPGMAPARLNGGDWVGPFELTWSDLALSYLWWTGGTSLQRDIRHGGRRTVKVEVPAPVWEPNLSKAHVWIDEKSKMMFQAISFNRVGTPLRYYEIDAVGQYKKGYYMPKRMVFGTMVDRIARRNKVTVNIDLSKVAEFAMPPRR